MSDPERTGRRRSENTLQREASILVPNLHPDLTSLPIADPRLTAIALKAREKAIDDAEAPAFQWGIE